MFSAKEKQVGKLDMSLLTLALISWAFEKEYSETPEQLLLIVSFLCFLASNLVLKLIQGLTRHRMVFLTGRPHTRPATLAKQSDGRSSSRTTW